MPLGLVLRDMRLDEAGKGDEEEEEEDHEAEIASSIRRERQ